MRSTLCALIAFIVSVLVMVLAGLTLSQREAIDSKEGTAEYRLYDDPADERQYLVIQTAAEVTDAEEPNELSKAELGVELVSPPPNGGNQENQQGEEDEDFRRGERFKVWVQHEG